MNHFELAKQRLEKWIEAAPERIVHFNDLSKGLSVQQYCDHWAHIPNVIQNVVFDIHLHLAADVTKMVNGSQ